MLKKRQITKKVIALFLAITMVLSVQIVAYAAVFDYSQFGGAMRIMVRLNDGSLIGGRSTGHSMEVWRSTDNGASWGNSVYSTITTNANIEFGDLTFLVVPGTTTVFSAWREYANSKFAVVVGKSTNNGLTWSYDSTIVSNSTLFVGAPCLFLSNGNLQCYYDSEEIAEYSGYIGQQWVAMVSRNGLTGLWNKYGSLPVVVSRDKDINLLAKDGLTSVIDLGNNTIMCVVESGEVDGAHSNVIREVRSYDGGATWDYANRRILYQSPVDPVTGNRFNSYCPHAIKMSDGTIAVTFCTDEDFASPPDASNTPVESRRSHIKVIRSMNSDFTEWTAPLTVWNANSLSYLPGLFENTTNNLLVTTALFYGNQQFTDLTYNGTGTIDFKNGNTYSGSITGLLPNGQGVKTYSFGANYNGNWSSGSWSGSGVVTWTAGHTFTGTMTAEGYGTGVFFDAVNNVSWNCNLVNWIPYYAATPGNSTKLASNIYFIHSENFLSDIEPNTTKEGLLSAIAAVGGDNSAISVKYPNQTELSSIDVIKTGTKIEIANSQGTVSYTAVIFGDVNGDGLTDVLDLVATKRDLLKISSLSGAFKKAADMNNSGSVTISSLIAIKKQILGIATINQNCGGQKTMNYLDGSSYTGGWKNGGWFGQGTFTWASGATLVGNMTSTLNGNGMLDYKNGFTYFGNIVSLAPSGQGKFTWPGGETLEGNITGWLTGNGTLDYKNGTVFAGDVVGGIPNGNGKMTYPVGDTYEGAWSNGQWSGQGTFTWVAGPTFTGAMTSTLNGSGTIDYKNGITYVGNVVNLSASGQGKFIWASGETFEGNITGWLSGNGILTYIGGDVYTGDVLYGMPNGNGKMTYGWGGTYEGAWSNGQWSGQGVVVWPAGHTFTGTMTSVGNGTGVFYDAGAQSSFNSNLVEWVPYPA